MTLADVINGAARWCVEPCDLRFALGGFPDCSVDAVVCDPPYELGFMGKRWDASGIAFDPDTWARCLRVAKPGAHLLAFGGTRTWHRIAVAIEDAGWQVRDSIAWLYASGFPKSLDVSKAIDAALGAEREVVGEWHIPGRGSRAAHQEYGLTNDHGTITAPATPQARAAAGYGTALKPAFEPIIVARKPLDGTVAANFMRWGTGGIDVDGCRVGETGGTAKGSFPRGESNIGAGRWPANVILDDSQAAALDAQSGESVSRASGYDWGDSGNDNPARIARNIRSGVHFSDSGGASRFFFCAKASTAEREMGLSHLPPRTPAAVEAQGGFDKKGLKSPRAGAGRASAGRRNTHPTVKPVELMRWLVRLVTPKGGVVLDPFTGSGTTGVATMLEGDGRRFVGFDLDPYHVEIARARIAHVVGGGYERAVETEPQLERQVSLFGEVANG